MMLLDKLQVLKQDRFYGAITMLSLSIVGFLFAWLFYSSPKQEPSYEQKRLSDTKVCIDFAKHKGFSVSTPTNRIVEITNNNLNSATFIYATAESVILACSNFELKRFCLGVESECGLDGLKIVLGYENANAV